MKIEGRLFIIGTIFYAVVAVIYYLLSRDLVGTTALSGTGALAFIAGFYLLFTARRVYPRPEDRLDGEIDEADPNFGFYSPHSWWPFVLGLACAIVLMGLVFAIWLLVAGATLLVISLVGWMFEYYRKEFAH